MHVQDVGAKEPPDDASELLAKQRLLLHDRVVDGKAEVDAPRNDLDTADSPPANSLTDLVAVRLADDDYHCANL